MRRFSKPAWVQVGVLSALLVLVLSDAALAAEGGQQWRPMYDITMRWINFAILVFLLYKYARKPLLDFLKGERGEIEKALAKVEAEKNEILEQVKQANQALEESKVRLPELKARLIEQGERRKEELIQDARAQSLLVMEGARHKIEYQILRAREKLVVELLDMAIEEALKEMPHVITAEDDRRRVEKFLAIAEAR
jgi:F-type H+-transporting ATPase subunit b